mgnify:FL=1
MRQAFFPVIVAIALCAAGCANLAPVRQLAETANQSLTPFPALVDDFSASCQRRGDYQPPSIQPDCAPFETAEASVLAVGEVLRSYTEALGRLAGDDLVTFTRDVDALENEVRRFPKIDTGTVSAVSNVAGFLSTAATEGYRRKAVKRAIIQTNGAVQAMIIGLREIIGTDYGELLALERQAAWKYYEKLIRRYEDTEPLAVMLLRDKYDADLAAIDRRAAAAESLDALLRKTASAHQALFDSIEDLESKKLIDRVKIYVKEAGPLIRDLKGSF